MKIDLHRHTGEIIFSHTADVNSIKITVELAIREGVDLRNANLRNADLRGVDLRGVDLSGVDLSNSNLSSSDLRNASLRNVNLFIADLSDANLRGANLRGADLFGETLTKNPLIVINLPWWIMITEKYMKIGCKLYTHEEWEAFTNDEINAMDDKAASFWAFWKAPLLARCKAHATKEK